MTLAIGAATASIVLAPGVAPNVLIVTVLLAFLVCGAWRVLLVVVALGPRVGAQPPPPPSWPLYTVLAALHDEAEVAPQLIERLSQIDYPPARLEILLLLEAHDLETLQAAEAADRPPWMRILVVPPGKPGTKPRALNHGLAQARGELVTIYDAEDDPDPLQLREAAARFAADATGRLACLQAPLRIRTRASRRPGGVFLERQFAAEYAALFEITLPAMARMGLPFPLGGTSNHFRVDVLRRNGGWDAWNVTEDADLGFRLWRGGWRMGVMRRPTYESPPSTLEVWLPQRCRWLKGYMQTWGVHTRDLGGLGWRGLVSLVMTLGVGLLSAAIHAGTLAWVLASVIMAMAAGAAPNAPRLAMSVLVLGATAAWIQAWAGARRAHVPYSASDMAAAPVYWSILSLAFLHAAWRLVREPHAWDKTRHRRDPDASVEEAAGMDAPVADSGRRAA